MWALGSQHQREQPGQLGPSGPLGQSEQLGQSGQSWPLGQSGQLGPSGQSGPLLRQMDSLGRSAEAGGACLWLQRVWTLAA